MKTRNFLLFLALVFTSYIIPQVNYYYYPITSGTTSNLTYIYNLGSYNNFITGANGTLLRSTNSTSDVWSPVSLGTTNNLNGMMLRNTLTGVTSYIFGNSGTVLIGENSGATWSLQNSGVNTQLNAGSVVTGDSVQQFKYLIVGSGGTIIYKMVLGGSGNWVLLNGVSASNLNSVVFIGKIGWIAGSNGTILKSTNSGMNWSSQSTSILYELNSIYFANTSRGYIVGNGGIILRTENGGTNWTQITSGTTQNLNQVVPLGTDSIIFITGNNGTILKSINLGLNWSIESYVPNINFTSGYFINNYLFVVGDGGKIYRRALDTNYHNNNPIILSGNNIRSYFENHGIFDQNTNLVNMAGFEWPKGSNKTAIFTAGLNIAVKVNNEIKMASASYRGEYKPGYCVDGNFQTNLYFKFYKVTRGDNAQTNDDWANWGRMVPFGAPYVDVNNNGIYEPAIDTPGVRNAKETMFICLTDADTNSHLSYEGFGGGTKPIGAELHMTVWDYDSPSYLQDVQFINYDIINKSTNTWNMVKMGIYSDLDLGDASDDYIGCDTVLNLGFCYNGDNNDPQYGLNPPAVGMTLLRGPLNRSILPNIRLKVTSLTYTGCTGCLSIAPCEYDPGSNTIGAYRLLSGYKKDSTNWLDPTQNPPKKTKFCYSGDPESNIGWTEIKGSIWNCNGDTTGVYHTTNPPSDRRFIMGSGADNFSIIPGESQKFVIAQLIARGTSNLNSVTLLKNLTSQVINFYNTNFPIGINQISASVPDKFNLFQNYPNPFNPSTVIRFQIKDSRLVTLKVYDILGKEVTTLVNGKYEQGVYEVTFDGSSFSSGIYFYRLVAGDYTETKRMVLIK